MGIYGVQPSFSDKVKTSYVKNGAKVATAIEQYADKKIDNNSSIELWQKARAASISWQAKNTPNAVFGDHKKLQDKVMTVVDKMGLDIQQPCFSGPDRYDDYINIGGNWYYTSSFIGAAKQLGDETESFMQDIKKLYDEHGSVKMYGCTVKYKEDNPVSDVLNHIIESQKAKRGY